MIFLQSNHDGHSHEPVAAHQTASARRCPAVMMSVIVLMTLLVIVTGLNLGSVNHLIDLSARALLQQMAGG
jgi:hypothetical protein